MCYHFIREFTIKYCKKIITKYKNINIIIKKNYNKNKREKKVIMNRNKRIYNVVIMYNLKYI